MTLISTSSLKYNPSLLAATSVFLAKRILKRACAFPKTIETQSGYRLAQVKHCAEHIGFLLMRATDGEHLFEPLVSKYGEEYYGHVSLIPEQYRQHYMMVQLRGED